MIHPALQAFFNANATTTAAKRQAVNDQLTPIASVTTDVQHHILDLQAALTNAELAAHGPELDGSMNWMHVQLRGASQAAEAHRRTGRELAQRLAEVDAGLSTTYLQVSALQDARRAANPAPVLAPPAPAVAVPVPAQ